MATPAFESLTYPDGRRAFPIELEPFAHTRFEMADFARQAADLGVGYIGICCGGAPHYVRAMAEALGRQHLPAATRRRWTCIRCSAPRKTPRRRP